MELFSGLDLTTGCHLDHSGFLDAVLCPNIIQELMVHIKSPFSYAKNVVCLLLFWVQFRMGRGDKLGW